jgi:hypothetical protein
MEFVVDDVTARVGELLRYDSVWLSVAGNALMTGRAVVWMSLRPGDATEEQLIEAFQKHLLWADVDAFVCGDMAAVVVTPSSTRP